MDALTLFGSASVTIMLIAYTLERKSRVWILIFAMGCLSSAIYALLAGTIPFAIVESIWTVVAVIRWKNAGNDPPSDQMKG